MSGSCLAGSNWNAALRELSGRVAAAIGPGAVSVTVTNRSSLSQSDVDSIASELRGQLNSAGLRLVDKEQAAASVQVTLSENLQGYVWVAQVQQGTNPPAVLIVSAPRAGPAAAAHVPAPLAIAKIQVWSQEAQFLDVGVIDSPPRVVVLEAQRIALYSLQSRGAWEQQEQFPIPHTQPWPRDLRGRIVLRKDHLFDAYLPGMFCSANSGIPLSVNCRASDDPWPLSNETFPWSAFFSPTRNFFTGVVTPGAGKQASVAAFYSAAPVPRDKYVLWLFAAVDGQVHAFDGMRDQLVSGAAWGSDIATVKSGCGSGWQVLTTSRSDGNTPDKVSAYEVPDRTPVPVGEFVDFGGPVLALWSEQGGNTAIAVSRNLRTGIYEASRLAVSCGR